MKLTINTSSAVSGLSYIMPACGKSTIPILSNVLITPSPDGSVQFTASNAQQQLSANVPCEWSEQGSVTIEGKKFYDIFKKLPKDTDAKLSLKDGKAVLLCGKSRFTLNTLAAKEYPSFNANLETKSYTVNGVDLKKAMMKCRTSMPQKDARYFLNGMHIKFKGDSADVVATDGHRMGMEVISASGEPNEVIIPEPCVKSIIDVLDYDNVTINIGNSSLSVSDKSRSVTIRLVDGRYPDYNRVIPENNQNYATFNRADFIESIGRALLLSNEKFKTVKLYISRNECTIIGNNTSNEKSEEVVSCESNLESFEIGINGQYLIDALGSIDSETVTVKLGDSMDSVLIEDGSFNAVVMPVRL